MAYLTVRVKGEDGHRFHDLGGEHVTIGRSKDCDLQIDAELISRKHCELELIDGTWHLIDSGSANGTRVNQDKVAERVSLNERDVIKAGRARLTFHTGERPKKPKKPRSGPIDVDLGDGPVPSREVGVNDPPDAAPCEHCAVWLNIAHHMPGDLMTCPACGKSTTTPQLVH